MRRKIFCLLAFVSLFGAFIPSLSVSFYDLCDYVVCTMRCYREEALCHVFALMFPISSAVWISRLRIKPVFFRRLLFAFVIYLLSYYFSVKLEQHCEDKNTIIFCSLVRLGF